MSQPPRSLLVVLNAEDARRNGGSNDATGLYAKSYDATAVSMNSCRGSGGSSVDKVDRNAREEPEEKTNPCLECDRRHHGKAEHQADEWYQRPHRNPKRTSRVRL